MDKILSLLGKYNEFSDPSKVHAYNKILAATKKIYTK